MMDPREREAIFRESIDAWNADDWEDRLRGIWSPDGAIVAPEGWPESGEFHGWPAMVEEWGRLKDSWAEERVEAIELEPIGDRLLGCVRWTMRGEASGAPLEADVWVLCDFEGRLLSKMAYFLNEAAARAAAESHE